MAETPSPDNNIIVIRRKCFTQKNFAEHYNVPTANRSKFQPKKIAADLRDYVTHKASEPCRSLTSFLFSVVPILSWLPKYRLKEWIFSDVVSGITVGMMQIPQGMAYALLAGQHPIYGLYNAFFPVILYSILGTSRHISMGSTAITSLMVGSAVMSAIPDPEIVNGTFVGYSSEAEAKQVIDDERIMYGASMTFATGAFLLALSLVNLGSVVTYLSDPMISGFTCGAGLHVLISQLKGLFGVKVGSYSGPGKVIWVFRDLIVALTTLDEVGRKRTAATVVISVICIVFLLLVKEFNERYKSKLPLGIPIPGESIVVIVGTGISYAVNLNALYYVKIVGNIPSGLPVPSDQAISKLPTVFGEAIPVAIVGYAVSVSIAKVFAYNFGYTIRPNQELVAFGASNLAVSFFYCIPAFPAMSRSCVQVDSGGKTQVVGFIAAFLMLLVLLWIGPLFESIPRACLAAIIAVAIKGMLRKVRDFKPFWDTSKLDGAVWLVACLGTIFLDVVYGLVAGVAFSMLCVVLRTQFVHAQLLSQVANTEIYRKAEESCDKKVGSEDSSLDCAVVSFGGPLYYVNKDHLRAKLVEVCGKNPSVEKARRKKEQKRQEEMEAKKIKDEKSDNVKARKTSQGNRYDEEIPSDDAVQNTQATSVSVLTPGVKCIVIDCTLMSFVDSVGLKTLKKMFDEFGDIDIQLYLSNVCDEVMNVLRRGGFVTKFSDDVIFMTSHDAVTCWYHKTSTASQLEE